MSHQYCTKDNYIFVENFNRSHVILVQIKTKNGKWVDYEKCYSKQGFGPKDYIQHFYNAKSRLAFVDNNSAADIRILNGMRKQVFGRASEEINGLFGNVKVCHDQKGYLHFPYRAKIVSIRFKESASLPDSKQEQILITSFHEEKGWNEFCKVLTKISADHKGFKSMTDVALSPDDNFLHWYKVTCNSGLEFSFALYF